MKMPRIFKSAVHRMVNAAREKSVNKNTFGNKQNLNSTDGNELIGQMIREGKPFIVTRLGFAEIAFLQECLKNDNWKKGNHSFKNAKMAEIFDNDPEQIERYVNQLKQVYSETDIFSCWYKTKQEGRLIEKLGYKDASCTDYLALEPFFMDNPWTKALEGKRVLVVTAFANTVSKQYENIEKIFPTGFMPKFELKTIQSVWYAPTPGKDEKFSTWNDALVYLEKQVKTQDFDIALLACGPFGVPLLHTIKNMGKQGIYVGGVLQIMFGIRGGRWDAYPDFCNMYNEYWVRPDGDNRPKGASNYENGCYW